MNKHKHLLCACLVLSALFVFPMPRGFAGIGDGLTDVEKRKLFGETKILFESLKEVIRDLKKVNVRLKDLATLDVENLKQTHAEILSQVEMIQKLIPDLRGIVEQSQIDMNRRIGSLQSNVTQAISNIERKMQQQEQVRDKFQTGMLADLVQLQQNIKKDMKTFAELNKQSFDGFSKVNAKAFQKVVANINQQNQKMAQANKDLLDMLRKELVPAIQDTMVKNFDKIESKNIKMIEILKKNLSEQQVANKKIALLEENLAKANSNVMTVGGGVKKLQDSLGKRVDALIKGQANMATQTGKISRISEKVAALKNQGNSVGNSLNTLHASVARLQEITSHAEESISKQNDITVKTMETFSNQLGQKLDQSILKADQGVADGKLSQEKIDKMIGILETAMVNGSLDEKIDQAVLKIESGQTGVDLANEKLTKLIEILKAIVKTQGGLDQIKKDQGVIKESLADLKGSTKESLADLRRKANVNISRNDDIKKTVSKIQKTLPSASKKQIP